MALLGLKLLTFKDIINSHAFLFLPGSGGCFLKGIFYYYLHTKIGIHNPPKLVIDKDLGHCHNIFTGSNYHNFNEILELKKKSPDVKVVVISIEPDDLITIAKMRFHKLKDKHLANGITDQISIGQRNWNDSIDYTQVDLCVKFKTIIGTSGEDLSQIITDYLDTETLPEVNEFINLYREVNTKLYIST